jgi:hypothetical protein
MSDMNTVQQNGSMIVHPNVEADDEHNVSIAMKSNGPNLSFALTKFNSVAPIDVNDQHSERDQHSGFVQQEV